MPQREFDILIGPDGKVQVEVLGYKGSSCLDAIKIFEEMIGPVETRRETSEFYEPDEEVRIIKKQRH